METPQTDKSNREVCQIRIAFPVDTDDKAIEYKKKVAAVFTDVQDVMINFSISPLPPMPQR